MKNDWQHMKGGNGFADAMMAQGNSTSMIGPHGPRYAGIITSLPKREGWQGQAMMGGVPVDPSGYGMTEFDTDKFPSLFGSNGGQPSMQQLGDSIGIENMMDLQSEEDFNHAMKSYGHIADTDLKYKNYAEMLGEGYGGSSAYATMNDDGTPHISMSTRQENDKESSRVMTHEFDHIGEQVHPDQNMMVRKGNARYPHDVRPHEVRASNSASRALFDNRFTNPKSPWFIHPSIDFNNPKFGTIFGMVGPDISTDRVEIVQKYGKETGRNTDGPTISKAYKKNIDKERDKLKKLWKGNKEFREALGPLLQSGISH